MNPISDILIIGGGVIGLAIAIELKLRGATVTVLSRDFQQAASQAAAGMLASNAERIPPGAMLDLCLRSQMLYPDWISQLEDLSGSATEYWSCGILAPAYTENEELKNHPIPTQRIWLDQTAICYAQPGLSTEVIGGWWFPEDGQVNNRALMQTLRSTAQSLGVNLQEGIVVTAVQQQHGQITVLKTNAGDWQAEHYILATGAWSQELLPVPVFPKKGQILSLRTPQSPSERPLQRVLYGDDIYIVPRRDGRIVIGATVEESGFTPYNTPAGLQQLLSAAIRLYPCLQDMPLQECWWGFRPATPDQLPILGASLCENLTLAIGHYRNGILLAPITAHLIADFVWNRQPDPLLSYFAWERFFTRAANSSLIINSPSGIVNLSRGDKNGS